MINRQAPSNMTLGDMQGGQRVPRPKPSNATDTAYDGGLINDTFPNPGRQRPWMPGKGGRSFPGFPSPKPGPWRPQPMPLPGIIDQLRPWQPNPGIMPIPQPMPRPDDRWSPQPMPRPDDGRITLPGFPSPRPGDEGRSFPGFPSPGDRWSPKPPPNFIDRARPSPDGQWRTQPVEPVKPLPGVIDQLKPYKPQPMPQQPDQGQQYKPAVMPHWWKEGMPLPGQGGGPGGLLGQYASR